MTDLYHSTPEAKAVQSSKWYPVYHVAPPIGWLNDPNGFSYYKGEYHIFYQHHPYSVNWGPMHWGHATSKDLFHWTHQPIAIAPGAFTEGKEWYDWDGCFSGCGYEFDGKLWLMYTSQRFNGESGTNASANPSGYNPSGSAGGGNVTERQCFAYSEDGIHFTKYEKNPVIDIPNGHPIIANIDFRDPKIWDHDGKYYCAIGNRIHDRSRTQIVLFESENFFDWKFKSVAAISKPDYSEGTMWECPGFAHFGDKYVMIISPQHVPPQGRLFHNIHQAGYMVGTLDYETGVFDHGEFFTFDYGFDFYATTMMKDPNGRYLIIGWMAAWQSPFAEQEDGWATILTIPRELKMREDGRVITVPPAEYESMRGEGVHYKDLILDKATKLDGVKGNVGELLVEIDTKKSKKFAIELCTDGEEKTVLSYDEDTHVMALNRDNTRAGGKGVREADITPFDILKLRIFLDKSSIEIFVNDGEYVFSTRVYPGPESNNIVFVPQTETLEIKSVDFYKF
ncbi:MAG: glycoside hydrolase family 32 protein [Selenomonadaceae bacterium]|nr:glycoside hydrolase family 32 protein [Selenomonadaceae bacterium]